MEDELPGVVNYNIAAKKRGDSITFLRKIVRGGTDDSYGIEVAKLAGVPDQVVKRAKEILSNIETDRPVMKVERKEERSDFDLFSGITASKENEVSDRLRSVDINTLTPIEAMTVLFELQKDAKNI
jgi:DNA mismatch repair protein MutS